MRAQSLSLSSLGAISRASAASGALRLACRPNVPVRNMGILDRIKGFAESKTAEAKEQAKEKLFQQQMEFMTKNPTYTMNDHVKLYEGIAEQAGVTGWRKMLLTDAQKAELAEQLVDLKIGAELTEAEKADISLIDPKVKARVVAAVGCDVERINRFLDSYTQSARIHLWLQGRKGRGLAIPSNMTEFVHCMMADRQHFQAANKGPGRMKTKAAMKASLRRM